MKKQETVIGVGGNEIYDSEIHENSRKSIEGLEWALKSTFTKILLNKEISDCAFCDIVEGDCYECLIKIICDEDYNRLFAYYRNCKHYPWIIKDWQRDRLLEMFMTAISSIESNRYRNNL